MKTNTPLSNATIGPMQTTPVATNVPVAADLPPPFPQIQTGEVPAVLVPPITENLMNDPMITSVISIFGQLPDLGLETYEANDFSTVIYNPQVIDEPTLQDAESNGNLAQVAIPLIGGEEMATAPQMQAAGPLANAQVAAPQASAPSNVNKSRLTTARTRNITPKQISPVQPNPISSQLGMRAV